MRILVTGLIGHYAFGGVFWDYIQYVLGFRALGHDVWYFEDTGAWAYHPVLQEPSADCSHNLAYLGRVMDDFGMGDRWIYRNEADKQYHGAAQGRSAESVIASADVLVNVSGACWLRPETARIPRKLFLDGDPMFTQIGMIEDDRTGGHIRAHDAHFSFGLHIGHPGCRVPEGGLHWRPTVQPIAPDHWLCTGRDGHVAEGAWTTVMNWSSYAPKEYAGESYGQKDGEFLRFLDLPGATGERFVLGMGQGVGRRRPTQLLSGAGWCIVEPDEHLPDYLTYRDFLAGSKAEWSVAKGGYVKSRSGWFSCRSACYLALGKPVVVQDTGWSSHLPSGDGALAFTTFEEAVRAIHHVRDNYPHHQQAARAYARKHFHAPDVCSQLLDPR
jgi:hypothetical protein